MVVGGTANFTQREALWDGLTEQIDLFQRSRRGGCCEQWESCGSGWLGLRTWWNW
jgi:hypothetical protein